MCVHGEGVVYRQLKKVILNLLSGVLEAHQNRLVRYKLVSSVTPPPPGCAAPVFMMRLGQRSESCLAQVPGLLSPGDASNFDAGPDQIRISTSNSSRVPVGRPLWQRLFPVCLTPMFPGFISLRFLTPGSNVHLMICFIFELQLQPGTELWKTIFTLKKLHILNRNQSSFSADPLCHRGVLKEPATLKVQTVP